MPEVQTSIWILVTLCGSTALLAAVGWWLVARVRQSYIAQIKNRRLRQHLTQAMAYRDQLQTLLKKTSEDRSRTRLENLVTQVNAWATDIEALTHRIDGYKQNKLLRRDLTRLPSKIKALNRQLDQETDPDLRAKLSNTLESQEMQLAALEKLHETMRKAELELEQTLSSLGTIYSQVVTGQSSRQVADYSRLTAEAEEQVNTLNDYLTAMEEVHNERRTRLGGL